MDDGEAADEPGDWCGEPIAVESSPTAAETQAAFEAFLAEFEARNPDVGGARLQADVDALLGRPSSIAPVSGTPRRTTDGPLAVDDEEDDGGVDFEWYSNLVSLAPAVDDERVIAAAKAVEVGLFAKERLESGDAGEDCCSDRDAGDHDLDPRVLALRLGPTRREAQELRALIDHGEVEWKFLILSNIRLVFHWSKGVARSVDSDWAQDAFQVGCIGLIRGLQGWDYKLGYKLSTFVSWHIRQAIQRWRANDILLIRLPVHVWESLERDPKSLSPEVLAATERAQNLRSLDGIDGDDETKVWDGGLRRLEADVERKRFVRLLLESLDSREAEVLKMRHGLGAGFDEPQTLETIGESMGVTRERIRQIEKKALEKLRGRISDPSDWLDLEC